MYHRLLLAETVRRRSYLLDIMGDWSKIRDDWSQIKGKLVSDQRKLVLNQRYMSCLVFNHPHSEGW